MPGNRHIYEQAMKKGHSAAWDQEWDKAIAAYGRAVQEMPEDPAAHNSLGLALLQARRLEDALKVYTRAHQLANDDPIPLEKSADVLERLGRLREAAQQYVNVAEIYLGQRDLEKAIGNWERATQLTPGLMQIHQRLALAYERTGQRKQAIREYLTLAFNFQRRERPDIATQAVERALRIDPNNPQALNTKAAIESGSLIPEEHIQADKFEDEQASPALEQPKPRDDFAIETDHDVGEADPRGPLGETVETALSSLAEYLFDSGGAMEAGGIQASKGIAAQRQGNSGAAIDAYQHALNDKMSHASIHFNLGVLYLENEDYDPAIEHLQIATQDPQLVAGAMHGLSRAYAATGQERAAANHLVQTLRQVDIQLAINDEEATQLSAIYDRLKANINEADQQQLHSMNDRFLDLLTGPVWKQRVAKTRRQLEEAITLGESESLISIAIDIDAGVIEGMNLVDEYLRDGLMNLAIDQAHFILEAAPSYLPIHWRIGQILLERNNIQAAIEKFNLVADTYLMRGDNERATQILQEALKIAPMDVGIHESLITLLEAEEQWEALLDQYIDLADAYYQLADLEAARSTFQAANQLAQRIEAPLEKTVQILHRLADIDVSRLELRQAMRTYEQIRKLDPSDEHARRSLVDLNYRLNDPVSAIRELDGLLRIYARDHRADRIIQVLEEQVTRYPKDMALRSRLAAVYRQTNKIENAVAHLDALAELQLEGGMHNDALVTIRRIIAINPPQVDDYRQLLHQLGGGNN
jgi:tetratricopeptide (TPR) repeat protein